MTTKETTAEENVTPDLSVVIPVFNGEEHLDTIVQGLLCHKGMTFEIILVDDCSTDSTFSIAEKFAQNPIVHTYRLPEHKGQSAAKNFGISVARGEYITFLDANDILMDPLANAVQIAKMMKIDVLHPALHVTSVPDQFLHMSGRFMGAFMEEFPPSGDRAVRMELTPTEIIKYFLEHNIRWTHHGKIYRREFLLENNIQFQEDMQLAEGMFFFLSCILKAEGYASYPFALYFFRNVGASLFHRKRAEEDLWGLLEVEKQGLERLETILHDQPYQELLPLVKERFCAQMDQIIEPISLESPEIWEATIREENPLCREPWWVARHLAGWHQVSVEKRLLQKENQLQQKLMSATNEILDEVLKVPRIIVIASIYTMLLCMLYFRDWDKSIFVCCGGVPSPVIRNLRNQKVLCYGKGDGKFVNDVNILQCLARYAERNHIPIYGNDDSPEAVYFIEHDFLVVEDGNANYFPELIEKQENSRRITPAGESYLPFGFNRFVKRVLLTGKHPIPDILKDKAEMIRMQDLWDRKTQKEQEKILRLFAFPIKEVERRLKKGTDCLLLGSDNAGKGICKEEQEIAMYRDMMEPYGQKCFMIKPHHQNKVDLAKYFPDCYILPKEFPVDLMKLLRLKLRRVVGAESSALSNLFPSKIVEDRVDLMRKHGIPVSTDSQNAKKQEAKATETEG